MNTTIYNIEHPRLLLILELISLNINCHILRYKISIIYQASKKVFDLIRSDVNTIHANSLTHTQYTPIQYILIYNVCNVSSQM